MAASAEQQRLASFISQAIHGEYEGIEVYGTSASNDSVYIEGDIDGREFAATVMVMTFSLVDDDEGEE